MNEDLFERAIDLLERYWDEGERIYDLQFGVPIDEDLTKAWLEHQALVATMKEITPAERDRLVEIYKTELAQAEPYDPDPIPVVLGDVVPRAELNHLGTMVAELEALLEDIRRARLLTP